MTSESPGFANQNSSYSAEITRRAVFVTLARGSSGDIGSVAGGIRGPGDCAVTAPVSGMSVNVAPGEALVGGQSSTTQGGYYGRVSSTTNLVIAAANPSNPRTDLVVAQITDSAYSGATNTFAPVIVTGTPASSPSPPAAPTSSLVLAQVAVPASATSITSGDITDERTVVQLTPAMFQSALTVAAVADYHWTRQTSDYNAVSGDFVHAGSSVTVTLPTPTVNAHVLVFSDGAVTVAAPDTGLYGVGLSGASSMPLGTPGSAAECWADGSNWFVVSGGPDTGWVPLTLGTNIEASPDAYTPSVRMTADGVVRLKGVLQATGTVATEAVLATVGTAFCPTTGIGDDHVSLPAIGPSGIVFLQVYSVGASEGAGTIRGPGLSSGNTVLLDGLTYTLS